MGVTNPEVVTEYARGERVRGTEMAKTPRMEQIEAMLADAGKYEHPPTGR